MEGKVNSSAGQKSYVEKIPCYQKSQYIWIKRFIEVNKDWDEGMINERAERLSAVYYKEILKQDLPKNNTIKVEERQADFINIVAWSKLGEFCSKIKESML